MGLTWTTYVYVYALLVHASYGDLDGAIRYFTLQRAGHLVYCVIYRLPRHFRGYYCLWIMVLQAGF